MTESLRPSHLPDFGNPPLNEVVLGVQFAPARGYTQLSAGAVWALYKSDFPLTQEMPPIAPAFETYGLHAVNPILDFGMVAGAQHDRFWFLSPDKSELIQFQNDRLLHNWRKVGDGANAYPRFESMIDKFESELKRLEIFFGGLSPQAISCNQVEISYINHIEAGHVGTPTEISKWLRVLDFGSEEPDDVSMSFRRTIVGDDGSPLGRLHCQLGTAADIQAKRKYVLIFTMRGAPREPNIPSALDFLKKGREFIITEFTARTTDSAHLAWERRS